MSKNYKNTGTPKNRSNDLSASELCKRTNDMLSAATTGHEKLNKIGAELDERAADIALTISDLFKFMSMSAALLPDMELDTGTMRLKVNDNGVFFGICYPESRKHRQCPGCCEEPDEDFDDEEGLLYDGD